MGRAEIEIAPGPHDRTPRRPGEKPRIDEGVDQIPAVIETDAPLAHALPDAHFERRPLEKVRTYTIDEGCKGHGSAT